jgi:hypothetical protein
VRDVAGKTKLEPRKATLTLSKATLKNLAVRTSLTAGGGAGIPPITKGRSCASICMA